MPTQCSFCHVLPIIIRCRSSRPSKINIHAESCRRHYNSISDRSPVATIPLIYSDTFLFYIRLFVPATFSFIFIPFRLNLTFLYAISSLHVVNYFIIRWNQCEPQNQRQIQAMSSSRLEKECN